MEKRLVCFLVKMMKHLYLILSKILPKFLFTVFRKLPAYRDISPAY